MLRYVSGILVVGNLLVTWRKAGSTVNCTATYRSKNARLIKDGES